MFIVANTGATRVPPIDSAVAYALTPAAYPQNAATLMSSTAVCASVA